MERVEIYNATLLRCISETNEISRSELEEKYLVPDPPGVVSGRNAMFDADLDNLISLGYIQFDGEVYRYIR